MSDRMLSDEILLGIINSKSGGGGGGGTDDYNDLKNQPKINNNTLVGNKTASDLGLVVAETGKGLSTNDYTDADKAIVGGVTAALADKQGALTAGDYISIDAQNNISVNRDLVPHQTSYRIKGTGRDTMNITKYIDGVQESSTDYVYVQGTTRTIDDAFTVNDTYSSAGYIWQFVWLKDSTTHDKDYTVEYRSYEGAFDFTEVFNDEDLSGYKLVIKSEMDDALADKQDKTDNNLQTTDKTVVGAVNELKSGLTNYQTQNDINLEVPDRKNVLKNTANSATVSGVLYTVNNDGSVSVSTETQSSNISSLTINDFTLPAGEYVLNGCSSGGSSGKYELQIAIGGNTYRDYGDGVSFTSTNQRCVVQILIRSGVTINDTFYPMIRPASITNPTFAPYIPSVESRIEAVESGVTNLGNKVFSAYGTQNADSWYKIGEYVLPEPNYIIHNFIVAIAGTQIKQVTLRCTPTGFDNDLTAVRQVYSESKNFAIRLASTSKVELYAKVGLTGRHTYSIISEAGNATYKVTLFDPVASSYTDTDMYIVN